MIGAWMGAAASLTAAAASLAWLFADRPWWALLAHAAAAATGLGAAQAWARPERPAGWHEIAWAFAVPIVGGPLAWLHLAGQAWSRNEAVVAEYARYLDAEERLGGERTAPVRTAWLPEPDHLESMADVIRSEASVEDKRLAIESLALMETPRAVGVLRMALTSPSTEVRFYAASVLSSLEERLGERLAALEQDVTLGRRKDPEVEFDLARCYFDYAYYGLAEGARKEQYLRQALEHTRRCRRERDLPEALLLEGRALLELGAYADAEPCFASYVRGHLGDGRGYLWRAEARYRLGNYAGVQSDCRAATDHGVKPPFLAPALDLWS